MRFRLALLLGIALVVAGIVAIVSAQDGDVTAGSSSTTTDAGSDSTTSTEAGNDTTTTTGEGDTTTTTDSGGSTTTTEAGDTTTTTDAGSTTTTTTTDTTTTTTTTAGGPDESGPTVSNLVISDQDLTEWCEGDPEENATMTISLQAEDPSGIEAVFVSWLVDLTDGVADLALSGDTWEAAILFESGTIFDIIEPQPIDLVIVAEDTAGNFTFVDRFGPTLSPQECG